MGDVVAMLAMSASHRACSAFSRSRASASRWRCSACHSSICTCIARICAVTMSRPSLSRQPSSVAARCAARGAPDKRRASSGDVYAPPWCSSPPEVPHMPHTAARALSSVDEAPKSSGKPSVPGEATNSAATSRIVNPSPSPRGEPFDITLALSIQQEYRWLNTGRPGRHRVLSRSLTVQREIVIVYLYCPR